MGPLPKSMLPLDPTRRPGCHYPFPQDLWRGPLPGGSRWSGFGALGRRLALSGRLSAALGGTGGPHAQALPTGAGLGWGSLGCHCQCWQPSRRLLPWDPGVCFGGPRGVKCAVKGTGGTGVRPRPRFSLSTSACPCNGRRPAAERWASFETIPGSSPDACSLLTLADR